MDINWTPFLKMLPQPFFCPSLLSSHQPAHHVNYMHTQAHACTQACMHMRNLYHSLCKLPVLWSSLVLAALCLLNLLSCGILIENGLSFFISIFFTLQPVPNLPLSPSYLRVAP